MIDEKVYLAGPMRGLPEFNFPAFFEAQEWLEMNGAKVFNPAERDTSMGFVATNLKGTEDEIAEQGFDLKKAMRDDLAYIVNEATMIVLMPGWSKSSGARRELEVAETCGLTVAYYVPGVMGWRLQGSPIHHDWPTYDYDDQEDVRVAGIISETRVIDPNTGGAKGSKLARFDLIPPDVLFELAEHYGKGSLKYDDRNWEKGYDWSLSYAAAQRHLNEFWMGEDYDEETQSKHVIAAAWHCIALAWFMDHRPEHDTRPSVEEDMDEWDHDGTAKVYNPAERDIDMNAKQVGALVPDLQGRDL